MQLLDLDMDYFIRNVATGIEEDEKERFAEEDYGDYVWSEEEVREFLEKNLGLSKKHKLPGRIVAGHNEALYFWKELISKELLNKPFKVVHVDSHADLGLGYSSYEYIMNEMLALPVEERPKHSSYLGINGKLKDIGIGDYLLYGIAYRWINEIIYCGNPCGECNDYLWNTLKDFHEEYIWNKPVLNVIQLLYNPNERIPEFNDSDILKKQYVKNSKKEPEVPLFIIPKIEDVHFDGKFDFAVLAQSPNYTPASADFIMDIFREYVNEI